MDPFILEGVWKRISGREQPPDGGARRPGGQVSLPADRWVIALALLALLLITAAAGAFRLYAVNTYDYSHPDEEIARAVVVRVLQTGDNDTNWARTGVSANFRYDQYNFSSYYLFAAYAEKLSADAETDVRHPVTVLNRNLRLLSAELGMLCVLFAGLLGWRQAGIPGALTAALLTACSATLFQDSLYARPETFVTLLTLLLLLVLSARNASRVLILGAAGLLVGLLLACKITFLLYLPFPLLLAPAFSKASAQTDAPNPDLGRWSAAILAYFVAICAGFALGAPYAVKYPWEFLAGVAHLLRQYSGGNAALSGAADNSHLLLHLGQSLPYVLYTVGYPALLLAVLGLARLIKHKDIRTALVIAGPLLTLLYFLQTQVFYERNFSQALPVLFVLAGMGLQALVSPLKSHRLRLAVGAVVLMLAAATPALVTAKIMDPALDGRYQQRIEAETLALSGNGAQEVLNISEDMDATALAGEGICGRYILISRYFNNEKKLDRLLQRGYRVIGKVPSVFGDGSISTLQTYLSPTMLYLAPPEPAPGSCRVELARLAPRPGQTAIHALLHLDGNWIPEPNGRKDLGSPWDGPLYVSLKDGYGSTGTLRLGPFRACGDFVLPMISGMAQDGVSLRIEQHTAHGAQVIFEGLPAPPLDGEWEQLTIRQPPHVCGSYSVTAVDNGRAFGDWLGIGMPFEVSGRTSE